MKIGARLAETNCPGDASFRRLVAMRARVVGMTWSEDVRHRRPIYDRLERELDRPTYSLRVMFDRMVSPRAWVHAARRALAEVPHEAIEQGRLRVVAMHEVNLPEYGAWLPHEYAAFLGTVRRIARLPRAVALVAAPISLGVPDWRDWWERFVAACGGAIPADCVAVDCHAHLVEHAAWFAGFGRPIDVTELGTIDIPAGQERVSWLRSVLNSLERAGVEHAIVYTTDHARDERWNLTDEESVALGEAETGPLTAIAESEQFETDHARDERRDLTDEESVALTEADAAGLASIVGGDPIEPAVPRLTGRGMFIWYLHAAEGGDIARIGARARAAGIGYVLLKCGDGGSVWSQFSPANVAALQAEGLAVYGWGYCYGQDVAGELAVAEACFAAGADGYVADMEAEYEGRPNEAEAFAAGLVALRPSGRLLGYAPLPVIDFHQALPYIQMNRIVDVVMPQFYCRALGDGWSPDRLWEQWRRWSDRWQSAGEPVPPTVPVGEAFGPASGDDLLALVAATREHGIDSMAFWEWSQARPEHWSALASLTDQIAAT